MSSQSTELTPRMAIYEQFHQISRWGDTFNADVSPSTGSSTIVQVDARLENKAEYISCEQVEHSRNDQETNKPAYKIQRRLAQNREAARKSRLKKKVYVQQLESSRLKLAQLEQEIERTRQQGIYISSASDTGYFGLSATVNPGITAFEKEYGYWVEEQNKQICELRSALQAHITDVELCILVESGLNHYRNLFRMKADAAKADVVYLISGIWRTSAERFFHWIGGFCPSELLNVVMSQIEPLTDQQHLEVCNLRQFSQQAEDALSQGIDKLQQDLGQSVAADFSSGNYRAQVASAIDKLEALEGFVNQADHLRQQTLQQMARILTTRQAARGLLALGEYFHRLRALSSLCSARPL
ncbi:transcription factor TGA3-like [Durio zibethinus]|uniref:Transcription factor TGA3-like n=1 Tax=Durio zibethinus TaxID=66656 RepID=A0A6P5YYS5_DURZI|nr:transcription factor TGA3-like [Durio zibethinus]XP_022745249.1 transcription factor TGA3-like [Durio zibethinus]XP_022745326.1 transcription factor TGA3-like [Durio zibethinus]XP_022745404.1 transcription factor TGA3-like [Durio zibethinus]XP_022745489.1 transcription factor TGA3-like [Durio zibethinus]XP_022745569.1 transcription factor TGA3-like [Durio zibethinus]XP_022745663.1 transcription factor TGA3-like [Durio zibethinus]XP_022745746.1 transcription factor TGA3-like [Durio zibethi